MQKGDAEYRASHREKDTLGQKLADEPRAFRRTQRFSHRDFLVTSTAARASIKLAISCTSDEQHQTHDTHQDIQRLPELAAHVR